jgi:2-amino-4-hydroxy-6-hydroxymethyldihydropteridine diphosphokinase
VKGVEAGERVFVGLGANLGDARGTVEAALTELGRLPATRLVARSPLYRTAPVDAGGPDFINAVAELRSTLQPAELLHALQGIEASHGRERPFRHAPRTLDLDLLLHGQLSLKTPELLVPHPRLHQRAFVLRPLLDLAADLRHPELGRLADWLPSTADQPIERLP